MLKHCKLFFTILIYQNATKSFTLNFHCIYVVKFHEIMWPYDNNSSEPFYKILVN